MLYSNNNVRSVPIALTNRSLTDYTNISQMDSLYTPYDCYKRIGSYNGNNAPFGTINNTNPIVSNMPTPNNNTPAVIIQPQQLQQSALLLQFQLRRQKQKCQLLQDRLMAKQVFVKQLQQVHQKLLDEYQMVVGLKEGRDRNGNNYNSTNHSIDHNPTNDNPSLTVPHLPEYIQQLHTQYQLQLRQYVQQIAELKHIIIRQEDVIQYMNDRSNQNNDSKAINMESNGIPYINNLRNNQGSILENNLKNNLENNIYQNHTNNNIINQLSMVRLSESHGSKDWQNNNQNRPKQHNLSIKNINHTHNQNNIIPPKSNNNPNNLKNNNNPYSLKNNNNNSNSNNSNNLLNLIHTQILQNPHKYSKFIYQFIYMANQYLQLQSENNIMKKLKIAWKWVKDIVGGGLGSGGLGNVQLERADEINKRGDKERKRNKWKQQEQKQQNTNASINPIHTSKAINQIRMRTQPNYEQYPSQEHSNRPNGSINRHNYHNMTRNSKNSENNENSGNKRSSNRSNRIKTNYQQDGIGESPSFNGRGMIKKSGGGGIKMCHREEGKCSQTYQDDDDDDENHMQGHYQQMDDNNISYAKSNNDRVRSVSHVQTTKPTNHKNDYQASASNHHHIRHVSQNQSKKTQKRPVQ